jgi:hypothetical protein
MLVASLVDTFHVERRLHFCSILFGKLVQNAEFVRARNVCHTSRKIYLQSADEPLKTTIYKATIRLCIVQLDVLLNRKPTHSDLLLNVASRIESTSERTKPLRILTIRQGPIISLTNFKSSRTIVSNFFNNLSASIPFERCLVGYSHEQVRMIFCGLCLFSLNNDVEIVCTCVRFPRAMWLALYVCVCRCRLNSQNVEIFSRYYFLGPVAILEAGLNVSLRVVVC